MSWTEQAACSTSDPELWFPPIGSDSGRYAKRICAECPVKTQCLEYALEREADHTFWLAFGIWGGLSSSERDALRKKRRAGRKAS